ncbi:hypothetical protein ACOME3_009423 [Neoechinorhynchus agilis]
MDHVINGCNRMNAAFSRVFNTVCSYERSSSTSKTTSILPDSSSCDRRAEIVDDRSMFKSTGSLSSLDEGPISDKVLAKLDRIKIKHQLWPVRRVALLADDILRWRVPYSPLLLALFVSFVFGTFALTPPLVSCATCITLILTLDRLLFGYGNESGNVEQEDEEEEESTDLNRSNDLKRLRHNIARWPTNWTKRDDAQLDDICNSLCEMRTEFWRAGRSIILCRTRQPLKFYFLTVVTLSLLAIVGQRINNLFLFYLYCMFMLLGPGWRRYQDRISRKLLRWACPDSTDDLGQSVD